MRNLSPLVKSFIDPKIQLAPGYDYGTALVQAAEACVGVTEQGSDNHGPMVEAFQSVISAPQGQAWCLDFMQTLIAYVEDLTGHGSLILPIEHVLTLWNECKGACAVITPNPGDLILWQMGNTTNGHCGMVIGRDGEHWLTIEGNTGPSGEIEREGDGVYQKRRLNGGSVTFRQLGFLRCFGV